MIIDVQTIFLILCITCIVQTIAIYLLIIVNHHNVNVKLWFYGNLILAIGEILVYLRNYINSNFITIILSNSMIILGEIALYLGILRFLEKKGKLFIISVSYALFILMFSYFTYVSNNFTLRVFIISTYLAIISLLVSFELFYNKISSIKLSSRFLAGVFLIHGCFYVARALISMLSNNKYVSFISSILQEFTFIVSIATSYLWTFGLIVMLSERVNADRKTAQERFESIFETSPDAVLFSNLKSGEIVEVNDKFLVLTGFSKEEVIRKTSVDLKMWMLPEQRESFVKEVEEYGHNEQFEFVLRKKDGVSITCLISAKKMELNGIVYMLSVLHDISNRKKAEEALKKSEEKFKVLSQAVEQSPTSVFITDINGAIQYVNKKSEELLGYSFEEAVGKTPNILKSEYQNPTVSKEIWRAVLSGNEWKGEFKNKKKNGEFFWESARISPIFNEKREIIQLLIIKEDITEKRRLEKELITQARIDVLTGISNRRFFIEQVANILSNKNVSKTQYAFIMMDIDYFKKINDTFGHAIGDIAIKAVADTCKNTLGTKGILGRIGGEEFAILLTVTNFEEAKLFGKEIRLNVENIELFDQGKNKIALTCSIGITKYNPSKDTIEDLMLRSDEALYTAKNEGRNRVVIIESR